MLSIAKRLVFSASTVKSPIRGHILAGKWQKILQRQRIHDQQWKLLSGVNGEKVKVPVVEAFREYINQNPLVRMYLQGGLDAIPETVQEFYDGQLGAVPAKPRPGVCYGYTWEQLLERFGMICQTPPSCSDTELIGIPFYSMLIDLMNTESGRCFFSIPEVNAHLKLIFDTYGEMLDSPLSLKHMNGEENGWLSPSALKRVEYSQYICDPSAPHYGFKSWHDWFTREIKEEARPCNNDQNEIINNSESYPYLLAHNVQWKEKFWLKDQKYALSQIFDVHNLPQNEQDYFKRHFVGGTVYQGFLSPWCYHRWRAPVTGVIEKCYSAGHSYCVSNPNLNRSFKENYVSSQPMLSMVSGRQIYIIKADNPLIGRVCCVEIGMAEVSGIKNLVREGQRINKGDLLGYFRFGGSSHAIIFDNQASNLRFNPSIFQREVSKQTGLQESFLQKVRSPLAWVS